MKSQRSKVKSQNCKSKFKTFYFLIVFLTFEFLFLNLSKASASDLSLGISPPIIQIQIAPPATISTPITIHNYADETVVLAISLKPFTAAKSDATAAKARHHTVPGKGELGEVVYESGKNPLIFENIKVHDNDKPIEKIVIAPKQNKTLNLYIDIPDDEPISDYYFSVVFISQNNSKDSLNQSRIIGGIATNILLSIGRKEKSKAKIVGFSTPSFLEKGPVPFTIRLKNESKHFITPQGTISIKNMFGKTIGKIKLFPLNILEGSIRSQETLWQETLLFGPYTATLAINLSDKGPILVKNTSFLVVPIKALIGSTIILFMVILIQKRLKTHRHRL